MTDRQDSHLVFDWAAHGPLRFAAHGKVMLDDETLRDGLQSPSVTDPDLDTKLRILHLMDSLGIETADVGLPGAGARQREAVETLCREIADQGLRIRPNCAGRTLMVDIQPMAELSQRTGVAIEAMLFIGSSPIRQYAEEWDLDHILLHTREALEFATSEGLEVTYVTEDTVRSSPQHLRLLLSAAVEAGAHRVCLCDTAGAAVPQGVQNLVRWAGELLEEIGRPDVGIDWHGHSDRGLSLANTLAAIEAGATRVHGTALGIGERVGNTPIEQLLVNLKLLGLRDDDLTHLQEYAETVAHALGLHIPASAPIVGRDAFRTATGVHAAAVVKADNKGDSWLSDRIYSGVPAHWIGRQQEIVVGPMSGRSNVIFYLESRGWNHSPAIIEAVLEAAKTSDRVLEEDELLEIVRRFGDE
jgi:2-isopropylmalate synthase